MLWLMHTGYDDSGDNALEEMCGILNQYPSLMTSIFFIYFWMKHKI